MNSKDKGARFERTIANILKDYGYDARRTAQYCGNTGEAADVVGLNGIHIECKHYKTMGFSYEWLDQAERDAKDGLIPVVVHKINGRKPVVTMSLEEFLKLYSDTTLPDER